MDHHPHTRGKREICSLKTRTTLEFVKGMLRMKAQHWRTSKLREDMKTKSRCQGKVKRKKEKKQRKY